jgi:hypothetical protein
MAVTGILYDFIHDVSDKKSIMIAPLNNNPNGIAQFPSVLKAKDNIVGI